MRYLFIIFISVLTSQLTLAQTYEIGLFAGGSNFIGDVGSTKYINPKQPVFGGIFKWNRSARHSFRFSLLYSELVGDDKKSDDPRRKERGYSFNSHIIEASLGLEFTFWEFNLHSDKTNSVPYLYTGVTVAKHDNFHFSPSGNFINDDTYSLAYGIPMVLGYKTQVAENFILAAEIGARYTFSDEIDGSVPDAEGSIENASFGNINNNDWYVFTGLTLTYTFGETPCYCSF